MNDLQTPADRLDQLERAVRILHKLVKVLQALIPGPMKLALGKELDHLDRIVAEFPK